MSRLKQLEARRRVLLRQADAEREELAARLAALDPVRMLRASAQQAAAGGLRHPLAWAALAGVLLLGRTRRALTFVLWARGALAFVGRAAQLVRLLTRLRASRAEP